MEAELFFLRRGHGDDIMSEQRLHLSRLELHTRGSFFAIGAARAGKIEAQPCGFARRPGQAAKQVDIGKKRLRLTHQAGRSAVGQCRCMGEKRPIGRQRLSLGPDRHDSLLRGRKDNTFSQADVSSRGGAVQGES